MTPAPSAKHPGVQIMPVCNGIRARRADALGRANQKSKKE
jgi:hypothetical protein